jgi:hypothetical protein
MSEYLEHRTIDHIVRPVIIPILWNLSQKALIDAHEIPMSVIGTDYPLIFSYGIYNLAHCFGAIVTGSRNPQEIYRAHQERVKSDSRGISPESYKYIYVTDVLTDAKVDMFNYGSSIILAIIDARKDKNIKPPSVYSVAEL